MKKGIFEGTSTNGNIEEAIAKAIILAKNKLKADFIVWNLDSVAGANGGLIHSNIVTVSIKAKGVNVKKIKEKEAKAIKNKEVKVKEVKAKKVKTKVAAPVVVKTEVVKPITKTLNSKATPAKKGTVAKKVAPKK